jgi:hypothetical protein
MASSTERWILLQRPHGWLLGRLERGQAIVAELPPTEDRELAVAIAGILKQRHYRGEGIVLGVDSNACLIGSVLVDDPRVLRHRQRLIYEFEEALPVPAEELTVDFSVGNGRALGVAVQTATWTGVIESLQESGVQVQAIVPTAFLAASTVVDAKAREPVWLLWEDGQRVELLVVADGSPLDWRTMPADPKLLTQHLGMHALEAAPPSRIIFRSASDTTRAALESGSELKIDFLADSPTLVDAAIDAGDRLLRGNSTPWVDVRREALASSDPYKPVRGLLNLVTAAAVILLLAASGVLLFRAQRYEQAANAYLASQEEVFRDVLPGRRLPRGILRVLESEHAKAAGLTGQAADLPETTPMLVVVRELLTALPQGLRFRLNEVRCEQGRINIDGEVRTHADGDALAAALRRQGFQVPAPRTQQLPNQGVSIRLTAQYVPPKPEKPTTEPEPIETAPPQVTSVSMTNDQ